MTVILVNRHEVREIEHEEKVRWLRSILEQIGVPLDNWPENPSMENLRNMRTLLRKLEIDVINDSDDGLLIYFNNELVAQWVRPTYKMIEDSKEKDQRYRFYYEMHLNYSSVFDDNTTNEEE
ncbi:MAG TPA: hypothetical protein VMX17_17520 [Candidatus Glassbacteria bacterium]|nr:hypothetical protein [Candidatus Glassbacteria bacterium]